MLVYIFNLLILISAITLCVFLLLLRKLLVNYAFKMFLLAGILGALARAMKLFYAFNDNIMYGLSALSWIILGIGAIFLYFEMQHTLKKPLLKKVTTHLRGK